MNNIGKSGVVSAFGCVLASPSITSGNAGICTYSDTRIPSAINNSAAAKTGYSRPIN